MIQLEIFVLTSFSAIRSFWLFLGLDGTLTRSSPLSSSNASSQLS